MTLIMGRFDHRAALLPDFRGGECRDQWLLFDLADTTSRPYSRRDYQPDPPDVAEARKVCERCPMLDDCRSWALRNDEQGFWAGLTESERRQFRKKTA